MTTNSKSLEEIARKLVHRAHLEASLLREVKDTAQRDDLIEQVNRAQQAKEDARRAAADAARARLMHQVTETRLDQIKQHALSRCSGPWLLIHNGVINERRLQKHALREIPPPVLSGNVTVW